MIMRCFGLLLSLMLTTGASVGLANDLSRMHGTFLGYAWIIDENGEQVTEREMTVMVEGFQRDGLRIKWDSVELVDGRRDHEDVKYRSDEVLLTRSDNGQYFVASAPHSPFEQRDQDEPISGDPLRWATLEDDILRVYSFVILEDGRFEVQRYDRRRTDDGMELYFERIVDNEVRRQIKGFARRQAD